MIYKGPTGTKRDWVEFNNHVDIIKRHIRWLKQYNKTWVHAPRFGILSYTPLFECFIISELRTFFTLCSNDGFSYNLGKFPSTSTPLGIAYSIFAYIQSACEDVIKRLGAIDCVFCYQPPIFNYSQTPNP